MARRSATAAPTTDAEGNPVPAAAPRKQGPRTVYVMFKPGTDVSVIKAFQESLQEVSISRNAVFGAIQKASLEGQVVPFVSYQVKADSDEG